MKKRTPKKLSLLLCLLLTFGMFLGMFGCGKKNDTAKDTTEISSETTTEKEIGEGKTTFYFDVVDKDGNCSSFTIHTDKETVGEALTEHKLIQGEDGDYGLYVTTVNGITADYDTDQTYWAFYADDTYASTGVDQTKIKDGSHYAFKVER